MRIALLVPSVALRWAVVGTGSASQGVGRRLDVRYVVSRDIRTAKEFAAFLGQGEGRHRLEDALPQVDAVYLGVPTAAKRELALQAIAAGKHVLIEKPVPSISELAAACRRHSVVCSCGTVFPHAVAEVRARLANATEAGGSFTVPMPSADNIRHLGSRSAVNVIALHHTFPSGPLSAVSTRPTARLDILQNYIFSRSTKSSIFSPLQSD